MKACPACLRQHARGSMSQRSPVVASLRGQTARVPVRPGMSKASEALMSESKQYKTRARDLHRQVCLACAACRSAARRGDQCACAHVVN
jgi:hypothetical protein